MESVKDLVSSMQRQSGMDAKKITEMIDEKYEEFSGMITMEAAAHIVANEIGADIPKSANSGLQIKNLVSGMRNVNLVGKVFKISSVKDFQKKSGDKGKVVNIFISDGSGYTRVPLWNDQVKMVEDETVKVGDSIHVLNGFSKENIYGEVEVSIGKFGGIKKMEGEDSLPSLEDIEKSYFSEGRETTKIPELVPGKCEVRGTVVQIFKGKFLFETDGGESGLVISCVVDDGEGDIRVVFFRELAEKVSGIETKSLEGIDADARFDLVRKSMVGKEMSISGTAKKNKFFDALEIIADSVKDLNPLEESKRIAEELEAKIGG